jgi:hypothetical protein
MQKRKRQEKALILRDKHCSPTAENRSGLAGADIHAERGQRTLIRYPAVKDTQFFEMQSQTVYSQDLLSADSAELNGEPVTAGSSAAVFNKNMTGVRVPQLGIQIL